MDYKKYRILLVPFIILIMGVISISLMLLFQFRTVDEIRQIPFNKALFMLFETFLLVLLFNFSVRWLNRKFPWKNGWLLRAFFDLLLVLVQPLVIITLVGYADRIGLVHHHHANDDIKVFLFILPLVTSSLFLVIVEMIISVEEKNRLELKITHIEKEQLNSKYSALKEQLDHHFLFNNLSVLSSIIYEDVEKADRFIQDFSSIYRYVLRINQRHLVSVEEELEFIDNYLNLYKSRFENGFEFKVSVTDDIMKYLIPPLTLQVLVENAIKHNVISCKKPLTLSIESKEKKLLVRNTLQEKDVKESSTETGQSNLKEKYKLLECTAPIFKIEGNEYIAIITLIDPTETRIEN